MCAISGYYLLKSSKIEPKELVKISSGLLRAGQSRGSDACGFYANGTLVKQGKSFTSSKLVQRELKKVISERPRIAIFHNRLATQGDKKYNINNHPLKAGNWVAVHNGIITNYTEKTERLGLSWGENIVDSLLIPHILATSRRKSDLGKIKDLKYVNGGLTCAFINENKPNTLYLLGKDNPLVVAFVPKYRILLFASTEAMIEEALGEYQNNWLGYFHEGFSRPEYIKVEIEDKIVKINEKGFKLFDTWQDNYDYKTDYNYLNDSPKDDTKTLIYGGYDKHGNWVKYLKPREVSLTEYEKEMAKIEKEEALIEKKYSGNNYFHGDNGDRSFDKKLNDEVLEKQKGWLGG